MRTLAIIRARQVSDRFACICPAVALCEKSKPRSTRNYAESGTQLSLMCTANFSCISEPLRPRSTCGVGSSPVTQRRVQSIPSSNSSADKKALCQRRNLACDVQHQRAPIHEIKRNRRKLTWRGNGILFRGVFPPKRMTCRPANWISFRFDEAPPGENAHPTQTNLCASFFVHYRVSVGFIRASGSSSQSIFGDQLGHRRVNAWLVASRLFQVRGPA